MMHVKQTDESSDGIRKPSHTISKWKIWDTVLTGMVLSRRITTTSVCSGSEGVLSLWHSEIHMYIRHFPPLLLDSVLGVCYIELC